MKIALAGNPNCGKTTLFNALTGSNQFVGNWPGVTVEKKEGKYKQNGDVILTDLPGVYSLSPYTMEEVVARNYLVDEKPDAILDIVDGTNIERNLYLTTQLLELGIPVVIAVNMMDVVRKRGDIINFSELSKQFGCPVVEISALKQTGLNEAVNAAINAAKYTKPAPHHIFSGVVEHALAHIEEAVLHDMPENRQRWYAIKIFERDKKVIEKLKIDKQMLAHLEKDIKACEKEMDDEAESIITNERYNYITSIVKFCVKKGKRLSATEKIDSIVTNRFLALPIFALIMFLVYYVSITTVGKYCSNFFEEGIFGKGFTVFGKFIPGIPVLTENFLGFIGCAEWLKSLILNGIIAGVGSVLSFVPQMFVLFAFLAFLEACGYMSRIAFIMDKLFRKFGLSGKSFIPILIGTGCGVPGIMASRTIENPADRRMTVITTTFIPCGAKLPVIALIASSVFGGAWWVAISAYLIGITAIVLSGIILKKTKPFASEDSPFVMELPSYHMPTPINIWHSVWERGRSFIKKAGTVILLASIAVWVGSHFGTINGSFTFSLDMPLKSSVLGYIGSALSFLFIPLGFGNINASVATIMGLLAKEEIVAVFGVLDFGNINALGAFSFLIFNLLCAPCAAAMAAIKREMNSAKWTAFAITYQCTFAYAVSLLIYQIGTFVTGGTNYFGFACAFLVLCVLVYFIARKNKYKSIKN